MKVTKIQSSQLIEKILNSRKYRETGLNPLTIENLIAQEASNYASEKELLKSVRRKLHNIVAPYLGEPDYNALTMKLDQIQDTSLGSPDLRAFCLEVLSCHASTKERIPYSSAFYKKLFEKNGTPHSILDLACGLHPLAFPWMGLDLATQYYAYDIIQPRVDFINHFFKKIGLEPLAENRDVLIEPPQIAADLGIFFKEAHRFEKRNPGCNQGFWRGLNVKILAVSLPTQNLAGTHSLIEQHRTLVINNLPGEQSLEEIQFSDEIIFLIKEPGKRTFGE